MKKRNLLIFLIAIAVLTTGALLYLFKYKRSVISKTDVTHYAEAQQKTGGGHEGHESAEGRQKQTESTNEQQEGQLENGTPQVEISPEKQQLIGVKIAEATVRPLQKIIRTVGRIEYDERRFATVNTKFEGWIEKLYVDYTGKYVKKGEPLAEIYSPELVATQQEFINTLKWNSKFRSQDSKSENSNQRSEIGAMLSKDAFAIEEAARQRLRLWDISDAQIKKIEETGKVLRTLTIYSPVSGYVVQKTALQGMRIMPGEKLFDIADLSTLWIISDIYENELPFVTPGQNAMISLSFLPGREISSRVDYIYPYLSGETRTAKVRFTVPNPGGKLKPQMFTNVEIKIQLGKKLAIPNDAILDTGMRQIVYVDKGDGYFEPREVRVGMQAEGYREVLNGLKAGEKVASSATFLIDSEAQLKGVTPLSGHKH